MDNAGERGENCRNTVLECMRGKVPVHEWKGWPLMGTRKVTPVPGKVLRIRPRCGEESQ